MDFDQLLEKFGGISRYQVVLIAVVSILPFGTGFFSQVSVFFSAVPDYRCAVPPLENETQYNLTEENIASIMIPPDDPCVRYAYDLTSCTGNGNLTCVEGNMTDTIPCDNGYVYDDEYYKQTTVSEWDLVCDKVSLDSLANSLYFVGVFLGSFIIGPLMDWFGRRNTMFIMCIAVILTGIAVSASPTYEVYIAMRVLSAMTSIPCFIAYYTYANEISDKKWRTFVGMWANMVTAISHTILPLLAYFIRVWRYLGLCVCVLTTPYLVIYFFIPKSPRWLLAKGRSEEAKDIVMKYAKSRKQELDPDDWNLVVHTEKEKIESSQGSKKYVIPDLYRPPLMRMVSINVCYLWFVTSMVFYGLTLNVGSLVGEPYINSAINAFVEIIGYFAFLLGVRLLGMRLTSALAYFLSGVCCLTTMLLLEFSDGNEAMEEASRWIAILGKLFATAAFGLVYQYTTELYPTVARGTAMSMGSMSARVGSIIMPWTLQAQKTIPWLTQTIFGTLGVIAGATSLLLPETKNVDLKTSIDEAENFYRKNMKLTSSLLGKSNETYESNVKEENDTTSKHSADVTSYELKYDEGELHTHTSKL